MSTHYQTPDHSSGAFARTNVQTICQRVELIQKLLPLTRTIGEICCGDARGQRQLYREILGVTRYVGLDIDPAIVAENRAHGVECVLGDALSPSILAPFCDLDLLFFGPPLSVNCDGHTLFPFREVVPGYGEFCRLLFGQLGYQGTLVCICPRSTTLGDAQHLVAQIRAVAPTVNLPLIHSSYSTVTGSGSETPSRLKYVELWFTSHLPDSWIQRRSGQNQ